MVIEEWLLVSSPIETVWNIFADLTSWSKWNNVLKEVSSESPRVAEGVRLRYWIRPFVIPVPVEPVITEVIPGRKITWRGEIFGIVALHEYTFRETEQGVLVTSRETFSGGPIALTGMLFSMGRLREMTLTLLKELKDAAEKRKDKGRND